MGCIFNSQYDSFFGDQGATRLGLILCIIHSGLAKHDFMAAPNPIYYIWYYGYSKRSQ
jgi:hypothetical protein